MATVVMGYIMCVQSTMVEGTIIVQILIYCLRPFLLLANIMCINQVRSCAKLMLKQTIYHCQVIKSNRYYLGLLIVAMATIARLYVSPTVCGHRYITLLQYCNKLKYIFIA